MSGSTREVITLQLGHYSNFIGTHWWNIQNSSFVYHPTQTSGPKEVNNDVLFREGQTLQGETSYTPRLISFDLKGSLNTLKQTDTLYDIADSEEDINWRSDITLHKLDGATKNEYLRDLERQEAEVSNHKPLVDIDCKGESKEQDAYEMTVAEESASVSTTDGKLYCLDNSVQVWSDFLRPHLHPRSIHLIDSYQYDRDADAFDVFGYGVEVYSTKRYQQEIEDRLHFFSEECDSMQGFQLLVDPFNGFGGLASSMLDEIADDYSSKGIMVFASTPCMFRNSNAQQAWQRIVNTALTYVRVFGSDSLLLPLSLSAKPWQWTGSRRGLQIPHLQYQADLPYHTSAILASAVDSLTLPYRSVVNTSSMSHLTGALSYGGRKVVGVETSFPFPLSESAGLVDSLRRMEVKLPSVSLTSSCIPNTTPDVLSAVVRGLPQSQFGSHTDHASTGSTDVVTEYFRHLFPSTMRSVFTVQDPCRVVQPYPHIFDPHITTKGFISDRERPSNNGVESVPSVTLVQSSQSVGGHLEDLLTEALKVNLHRLNHMTEGGLEADDYQETIDTLRSHCQLYNTDSGDML